jgi:hypothetical protein
MRPSKPGAAPFTLRDPMSRDVTASGSAHYRSASCVSRVDIRAKFGVDFLKTRYRMACSVAIFSHATLLAGDVVGVTRKGASAGTGACGAVPQFEI